MVREYYNEKTKERAFLSTDKEFADWSREMNPSDILVRVGDYPWFYYTDLPVPSMYVEPRMSV